MDILAWVIGILIAIILFGVVLMGILWIIGEIIDMRDKVTHQDTKQ
jgi:hypothetical protein